MFLLVVLVLEATGRKPTLTRLLVHLLAGRRGKPRPIGARFHSCIFSLETVAPGGCGSPCLIQDLGASGVFNSLPGYTLTPGPLARMLPGMVTPISTSNPPLTNRV